MFCEEDSETAFEVSAFDYSESKKLSAFDHVENYLASKTKVETYRHAKYLKEAQNSIQASIAEIKAGDASYASIVDNYVSTNEVSVKAYATIGGAAGDVNAYETSFASTAKSLILNRGSYEGGIKALYNVGVANYRSYLNDFILTTVKDYQSKMKVEEQYLESDQLTSLISALQTTLASQTEGIFSPYNYPTVTSM